jgi:hypothetical protein
MSSPRSRLGESTVDVDTFVMGLFASLQAELYS